MSQNWPVADPGAAGWAAYSFWNVSYTTVQGQQDQGVVFAANAPDAILALKSSLDLKVYGPLTNVSAVPTTGTGFTGGGPDPLQQDNTP